MKSKKKIEKKAVGIIEALIDEIEYLDHDFNKDDKGISWDGNIIIYNGKIDEKENYMDSVDVQIKGRTISNKTFPAEYRFAVSKIDLQNYLKRDGTLFFVVLFKEKGEHQIYCAPLLPYNLRKYLNNIDEKNIKITLEQVNNAKQLEKFVRNFSIDKREQKKISEKIFTKDKLEEQSVISNVKFYDWRKYNENVFKLVGAEKYLYSYDSNNNIVSIEYGKIHGIVEPIEVNITNKEGKLFYTTINRSITTESKKVSFGGAFVLDFTNNKFDIKIQGRLSQRILQLEFIKSLISDGGFFLNEFFLPFNIIESEREKLDKQYVVHNKIKSFIKKHNIKVDINLDEWEDKEINRLLIWIDAIDYNKPIKVKQFETSVIGSIGIKEIRFSIHAIKRQDGGFYVHSIWNTTYDMKFLVTSDDEKKYIETSNIFLILNKEAYASDDININEMKKKIEEYKFSSTEEELVNLQVLEVIKAYDNTKKEELLEYAEFLLNKIEDNKELRDIVIINKSQIHKRKGILEDSMITKLIEIREKNDDFFFKISVNLLIDNLAEAKILFNKLTSEEKKTYLDFPISLFWGQGEKNK